MTLKTMTLHSFGRYKEVTIALDKGLNVLYGPNGAGKSTLIQFLLWMLYDPQHGKRTLREKLRERFRPWDGSALWGELEFTYNGIDYRMERFFDTAAKKRFAVYHGVTGDNVTEAFLPTPGEVLFGFGQEAFLRTFFVGQLSTPFEKEGKEDELQAALMNLSTSGNESVSAQKAQKLLEEAAKVFRLKTGKGGLIGASEEKLDRLYAMMEERRRKEGELHLKMQRLSQVEVAIAEQKKAKEAAGIAAQAQRTEALRALDAEAEAIQKELERLTLQQEGIDVVRLPEAEEACRVLKNTQERLSQLQTQREEEKVRRAVAEEQAKQAQKQAEEATKRKKTLLLVTGVVLGLLGVLGGLLAHVAMFTLLVVGAIAIVAGTLQKTKEIASYVESGLTDTGQIDNEVEKLLQKEAEAKDLLVSVFGREVLENDVRLAITRQNEQKIKQLQAEELQKRRVLLEQSGVAVDLQEDQSLLAEWGSLKAELENGFLGLPDLRSLTEEVAAEEERLAKLRQKHEALKLAESWIVEQAEVLRNSFGPQLNEAAANILSQLTNGAVQGVRVSGEYKMELTESAGSHELDYFSNGTVDQAYLALRLGILDLLQKNEDGPLLLDDVFCQYDDARLAAGIRFLAERAKKQQILYCTCRQEKYPEGTKIVNLDGLF